MLMRLRWKKMTALVSFVVLVSYLSLSVFSDTARPGWQHLHALQSPVLKANCNPENGSRTIDGAFPWGCYKPKYPVPTLRELPSALRLADIPKLQASPRHESPSARETRLRRLEAVKGNFTHAWSGYKKHAWLRDEVAPLSGGSNDRFGGWAATLVDSLDALWIMGLYDEFEEAVKALDSIDFTTCSMNELNVFETTIRYLGGFLAAYDLSGGNYPQLSQKVFDLGEMLYAAFDTPNRLPLTRWDFKKAANGEAQEAHDTVLVAEIGSLTLEFTRLSQLTGDPRFYDAVQRIMHVFDEQQMTTRIPGLWPVIVNGKKGAFNESGGFTIGGMVDSLYEYLPKQHLLLAGATQQYRNMYERALEAMKSFIFFRPMLPDNKDVLVPGSIDSDGVTPLEKLKVQPRAQHLGCFAGGMVAVGAKIFSRPDDLETARRLVDGCLRGYENAPLGIMPETMTMIACDQGKKCAWNAERWGKAVDVAHYSAESIEQKIKRNHLPMGVVKVNDTRYILRPEAIESVFILYRITGDETLQDRAWDMFNSIIAPTITEIAHAALEDCMVQNPQKTDSMESFWLAETLKYFFLIFSEPDVVSLDEFVLNTEAHPLRRPSRTILGCCAWI